MDDAMIKVYVSRCETSWTAENGAVVGEYAIQPTVRPPDKFLKP